MATDFATAPAFGVQPTHHYQLYGQGTGYSPINSATATPSNVSPTSTHTATTLSQLHLQSRQLRPPKTPLYVPAVLRPTEKPVRHSPPKHGGRSHLEGDALGDIRSRHGPNGSIGSTISRIVSDEWNDDALGAVTGPPTRNHWKVRSLFFSTLHNFRSAPSPFVLWSHTFAPHSVSFIVDA